MINAKTIIGVIIAAVLIGVLFVVFEKNLPNTKSLSNPNTSSSQEITQEQNTKQTSLLDLPSLPPSLPSINESSDLLNEASALEMRDYSGFFEELKKSLNAK